MLGKKKKNEKEKKKKNFCWKIFFAHLKASRPQIPFVPKKKSAFFKKKKVCVGKKKEKSFFSGWGGVALFFVKNWAPRKKFKRKEIFGFGGGGGFPKFGKPLSP